MLLTHDEAAMATAKGLAENLVKTAVSEYLQRNPIAGAAPPTAADARRAARRAAAGVSDRGGARALAAAAARRGGVRPPPPTRATRRRRAVPPMPMPGYGAPYGMPPYPPAYPPYGMRRDAAGLSADARRLRRARGATAEQLQRPPPQYAPSTLAQMAAAGGAAGRRRRRRTSRRRRRRPRDTCALNGFDSTLICAARRASRRIGRHEVFYCGAAQRTFLTRVDDASMYRGSAPRWRVGTGRASRPSGIGPAVLRGSRCFSARPSAAHGGCRGRGSSRRRRRRGATRTR